MIINERDCRKINLLYKKKEKKPLEKFYNCLNKAV